MAHSIRVVTTEEERDAVYLFRYRIYVEEMRRSQEYADHTLRLVREPLDAWGHLFAAFDERGQVVGTVRWNSGAEGSFGYYADLYELWRAGPYFPRQVSITTKLMVEPSLRGTTLGLDLAISTYRLGIQQDGKFDFIDCNPPLVPFFERLGYRSYRDRINHPEYGSVVPMVLAVDDLEHLTAVQSPFAAIAAHVRQTDPEALRILHERILPARQHVA